MPRCRASCHPPRHATPHHRACRAIHHTMPRYRAVGTSLYRISLNRPIVVGFAFAFVWFWMGFKVCECGGCGFFFRRKTPFSPYIFRRFPFYSLHFIFTTFSPYLKKRFSFWSLSLHQKQRKLMWQTAGINNTKLMSTWPKLIIKNVFWH